MADDKDQEPDLDAAWFAEADAYEGDRLVRKGRPQPDAGGQPSPPNCSNAPPPRVP